MMVTDSSRRMLRRSRVKSFAKAVKVRRQKAKSRKRRIRSPPHPLLLPSRLLHPLQFLQLLLLHRSQQRLGVRVGLRLLLALAAGGRRLLLLSVLRALRILLIAAARLLLHGLLLLQRDLEI